MSATPSGLWQIQTFCHEDRPESVNDLEACLFRSREAAIASVEEDLMHTADNGDGTSDPDMVDEILAAITELRMDGCCCLWETEYLVYEPRIVEDAS